LTGGAILIVSLSRCSTSTASTAKASTLAAASATRHEYANVSDTTSAGASAQPRLPVMPCTL